jgi:glycosyltransferase involved in cell wall biosynthesis
MPISIVIPAYNAAGFLAHTLDSVVAQTETDWKLIVVDDGSSDDTARIATEYAKADPRIRVISQDNGGVARARNTGAQAIDPGDDFVMFLDHDDILRPHALATLLPFLAAHPDTVGAHGLARKVDKDGRPLGEGEHGIQNYNRRKLEAGQTVIADRKEPTTAAMLVFDNLIPTPGVALLRRATIDLLIADSPAGELFDPASAPLDDWDFWLRVTRLGDLAFVDETVLDWRRHEAAGSQNIAAMSAAEMRIREKLIRQNLPADLAEVAEHRYRKLLVTTRRRAARDQWATAGKHLRSGRIGAGLSAWSGGMRSYVDYLRSR